MANDTAVADQVALMDRIEDALAATARDVRYFLPELTWNEADAVYYCTAIVAAYTRALSLTRPRRSS